MKSNSIYWLLSIFTSDWQFSCWGSWLIPSSHPILISLSKGHWVTPLIFSSKHEYIFFSQFSSVYQTCLTLWPQNTWTAAHQGSLSITNSWSLFKLMSIESVMHPTILSSVNPFSCLQTFQASGSFPMSQFFVSGDQSVGNSASASVLPMSIQDWFPLGWTGLIARWIG